MHFMTLLRRRIYATLESLPRICCPRDVERFFMTFINQGTSKFPGGVSNDNVNAIIRDVERQGYGNR